MSAVAQIGSSLRLLKATVPVTRNAMTGHLCASMRASLGWKASYRNAANSVYASGRSLKQAGLCRTD